MGVLFAIGQGGGEVQNAESTGDASGPWRRGRARTSSPGLPAPRVEPQSYPYVCPAAAGSQDTGRGRPWLKAGYTVVVGGE